MVSNQEFLTAIFGADAPWVHVTDFTYDPNGIPKDRHLSAWKGDYFSRYHFETTPSNQYFTISLFYADEKQQSRRRKNLFRSTPCIVLDDVKEKLSMDEVRKLPSPSWVLETSKGSEQWGYILNQPCEDRMQVENLLDGLVANGLAPNGRDPGMKGVTRYVRLPEGINNKSSKLINGQPYKCQLTLWEPFNRVTIEDLAKPFHVNLLAPRREVREDGAADVQDHPLLLIPELVHVKEVRSAGRFDITCPWTDEHTEQDDSGAAVFTNEDGTIGFKCHHGACQGRTARHLLQYIETSRPGFTTNYAAWRMRRTFSEVSDLTFLTGESDTVPSAPPVAPTAPAMTTPVQPESPPVTVTPLNDYLDQLRREPPTGDKARVIAANLLKCVDSLPEIERQHWHTEVRDIMRWSKPDFKAILNDLRSAWYQEQTADVNFFDDVIYIGELNQFMDRRKRIFYSSEAYQNVYSHLDPEVRKEALQGGRVFKVDRIDYAPKKPQVFTEGAITYGNTWTDADLPKGREGNVSKWLDHWDILGWSDYRDHMLQWMAFTIRYPDKKINHMMILGSGEGCGKDFLLTPLTVAMGDHTTTIQGDDLLDGFNEYLLGTKYLNINETELGDRREAVMVSNKLKPLAAAPPEKLRLNRKGMNHVQVRNIVNATMTTNSMLPIRLNGPSRRFFALWSDFNPRDDNDNMLDCWVQYWVDSWDWMNGEGEYEGQTPGYEYCVDYLLNKVDLSNFNPRVSPKITDFMRDIREASKSPAELTIDAFISERIGAFSGDLLNTTDAMTTIRAAAVMRPELFFIDSQWFTPQKVGNLVGAMPKVTKTRATKNGKSVRLWVLRDIDKYRRLSSSDLYDEYERQLIEAKQQKHLKVV